MTRAEILEKTAEIIRNNFDDDALVITDETTAADVEDWDSLEQINILVALEKQFATKFAVSEVEGLQNVGEMVDLIVKKVG